MPSMDEEEKIASRERQAAAKRGAAFGVLQSQPEWQNVAEIFYRLTDHWKRQLIKFKDGDTIDKIAIDRIRWTAMIAGLEMFFRTMQDDMEMSKEFEKNKDGNDDDFGSDKSSKPIDNNPFRAQNKDKL